MRKYRILIYYRYPILPTRGGVERVSIVLGEWLKSKGHIVYYLSDIYENNSPVFVHNNTGLADDDNFSALNQFVAKNRIDFILNQSAFLPSCQRLFEISRINNNVKIISIFHHSLEGMFAHPPIPFIPQKYGVFYSRIGILEKIFKYYFYLKYHNPLKLVVSKSDSVVVLSKHYITETEYFSCKSSNIVAIGNPLTLPVCSETLQKENVVVFLGRLVWQKNPFLLVKMWKEIFPQHEDWKLYFIGDGYNTDELLRLINKEHIQNVYLEGNQDPVPYLKRAKILCMTSMYEGFPLVLFEAMNYGVVPVVFDTFKSDEEIIKHEEDGFIVPPFKQEEYIRYVSNLMNDNSLYEQMSSNAMEKALANTIEEVGKLWIELFKNILK